MTEYEKLLNVENKIQLLEPLTRVKDHHRMKCMVCSHEWSATPLSKRQTYKKYGVGGCPNCNFIRKDSKHVDIRAANLAALNARGIEVLTPDYDGRRHYTDPSKPSIKYSQNNYTKIKVKNINCGHTFYCSPTNLLVLKVECGVCGPLRRVEVLTKLSKERSSVWRETADEWKVYKAEVESSTRINYHNNKKKINPKNLPRGKAGVEGAYHLDHIVPKRFCFDNDIPAEMCADVTNLQMMNWRDNVGSRENIKGSIPHIFTEYLGVDNKIEIYTDMLCDQLFVNGKTFVNVHGIVANVYDEELNAVIMIIPLGSLYANQKIGYNAARVFRENGVRYFIIFEDELDSDLALVVTKIQHYLNQTEVSNRIHARKCNIAEINDKATVSMFLSDNHVQGVGKANRSYGAYYEDKLVAVMTFAHPSVALGNKSKDRSEYIGKWELSRFATDITTRIPGIASKLLKHFTRNNEWSVVYSYADKRWSVGNLYTAIGFIETANNPADYFYVVDGVRKHRWNYRKDVIKHKFDNFDSNLTEYQNMVNNGLHRVWGCGTLKYELYNK